MPVLGVVNSWLVLIVLLLLVNTPGHSATPVECPVPGVTLSSVRAEDAEPACQAIAKALAFMADHGFRTDARFTIDVVDRPLSLHNTEVSGTYDARRFHIEVPAFSQAQRMAKRHPPFRMAMNRAMWQGFVAHEVAHAVAQANFRVRPPSLAAHEYIAYVVQLATLPEPVRRELLAGFRNTAFRLDREINATFLQLNPEVFAVKAYRHFVAQPNPGAFFQKLLDGGPNAS